MAYGEIYDHFGKALVVLFPQMVQLAHHQMHRYQLGATPRTGWKGLKSREAIQNRSLKNYGFLYDAIFLHVYACAQIT